jgi:hypothetical protein
MLKWVGGCFVLVVVLIAGGAWFAMRSLRDSLSPDGSVRVSIAATPERVYASMSNGDSLKTWMAQGSTVTTWRSGPLVVGDSIKVELRRSFGMSQPPMVWFVRELVPDRVVTLELTQGGARAVGVRRDSLVAAGDSTVVVSVLTSSLSDSTKSSAGGLAGDMVLSMVRLQAKLELQSLKARLESTPQTKTTR